MKRILAAGLSAGALVLLAACSSGTSSNTMPSGSGAMSSGMSMPTNTASPTSGMSASAAHNAADVSFATDMIPHHGQAIQMAAIALGKTSNAAIKRLATAIKDAQDPEIETMSGWLTGWGEPVPSTSTGLMPGMSMPGMMSDAEMADLDKATGADFNLMWVSMMIKHHTGAVTMAKTELTTGQNPDVKALAQSIITSQSAEISTLKQLLTTLPN